MRRAMVVAGLVLFGMWLGQPAQADTTGVAQVSGTASIGKWFSTPCDKSGAARVEGKGLYFPGGPGSGQREENGVWAFGGAGTAAGTTQAGLTSGAFAISACGQLGPVVDLTPGDRFTVANIGIGGASCGHSKAHHGQGFAQFANGERVKLYDLGWKLSVSDIAPVTGRYQEYLNDAGDPNSEGNKKQKYGLITGLAWMAGGIGCSGLDTPATNNANGAQTYVIQMGLLLTNVGSADIEEPKHEMDSTKKCKEVGPEDRTDPGGTKLHDNKPGTHPCTDADGGDKGSDDPPPPGNRPPSTPTLVAPSFGQSFAGGSPQLFTVRATDPDGDSYHGAVTVRVVGGAVAAVFDTAEAASGADSSGSPVSPLPPGSYTWTARACDSGSGQCSSESSTGFFRVVASGNQPPPAPQQISPADGHVFAAGAAQTFTVRATDPDGDLYRGEVAVSNLSGVQVASFETAYANSGTNSSGSPSPALPPGSYRWKARACDPLGSASCGAWSAERAVSVSSAIWESALCDQSTVTDGWVSDVFLRLTSKTPQPREAWVCMRADYQSAFNRGGRVVLTHSDPAAILRPGVAAACEPFTGTPLLNGEVGDSSDPATWFTYRAVLKQSAGVDTVCVRATRAGAPVLDQSIAVDAPGTGDVTATFLPDPVGVYPAVEDPPADPSRFSAECQLAPSGRTRIVNAEFGGVPVWVYGQQSGSTTRLCVRAANGGGHGGRFLIDGGSPGTFPIIVEPAAAEPDAPGSPCGVNVWSNTDPVLVKVRRTATDADPVGFCLNLGGAKLRVLVDRSPGGSPPTVTWTPDSA